MSKNKHDKLRMGFRHVFSSSYKGGHRRGVATLISNTLNYEHILTMQDESGRFVKTTGRIEGIEITLMNVYAPPGSEWTFYRHIFNLIVDSQGVVVCGVDFSVRLNPSLDSTGPTIQEKCLLRRVKSLMGELGIIDVWRDLYPTSKEFTHYSYPHLTYSRLDYFFMFGTDRFKVRDCSIKTTDLSDHSPIFLSLNLERKTRKVLWKLNSNILNDPKIRDKLKREIEDYLNFNDNGTVSPVILWNTLKAVMTGKVISITFYMKRLKGKRLVELQERLKQLLGTDSNNKNSTLKSEIRKIQSEIDDTEETQKKKCLPET